MAKKRKGQKFRLPPRHSTKKKAETTRPTVTYLLESGTLHDMREAKKQTAELLAYHWAFYSELEFQRNQVMEEIKGALIANCTRDFTFSKWQRAVKWKYGLHPLSTAGSLKFIGQRFNFGSEINLSATPFPALYIAEDKDTALQETLGQPGDDAKGMSAQELALTNPQSEVVVSVSGQLEMVLDLRKSESVTDFVSIIKKFKISDQHKIMAAKLGKPTPGLVKDEETLLKSILAPNWRVNPSRFDVPSNSQIFGHILATAGIEGAVYPSKLNQKSCIAIFTRNFEGSSSFIKFDDDPPLKHIPRQFDSTNFHLFDEKKIDPSH